MTTTSRRCRGCRSVGRSVRPMLSRAFGSGRRSPRKSGLVPRPTPCRYDPTCRVATVWGVRSKPRRRFWSGTPTSERRTARPSSDATWSERLDMRARRPRAAGAPSSGHRTTGTDVAVESKQLDADAVHANRARRDGGDRHGIADGLFVSVPAGRTGSSWPVRHGMSRCDAATNSRAAAWRVRTSAPPATLDPGRG